MGVGLGIAFLATETVLVVLTLLALVRTGFARLESSVGLWKDGLAVGKNAPPWTLTDTAGKLQRIPSHHHWQLLLFTDHSLMSFPSVLVGINHLVDFAHDLEVLVLISQDRKFCQSIARELRLLAPVVPVDQTFYQRYGVRVMPFVTLLDPNGIVRWVGLINTEAQLFHTWKMVRATTVQEDNFS
mgnify:CR=1 FL=1